MQGTVPGLPASPIAVSVFSTGVGTSLGVFRGGFEVRPVAPVISDKVQYYTEDRGKTFQPLRVPNESSLFASRHMFFHPDNPSWIIYLAGVECDSVFTSTCHEEALVTRNHGQHWTAVNQYTRGCQWAQTDKFISRTHGTIFCEEYATKHGSQFTLSQSRRQFVTSDDDFATVHTPFDNIVHFAIIEEYLVVAVFTGGGSNLRLQLSMNGETFAPAHLPGNVHDINKAYTVLNSKERAIFLHVTTSNAQGAEFGTLFTSNSNGTYYTSSLPYVNRNEQGLVDFEKMAGIEGIALVNQVRNPRELLRGGTASKEIQSRISFDNGASWRSLAAPGRDSLGHPFQCDGEGCGLHLNSFTVRSDPVNILSASSAVGLMLGVGNVGSRLLPYRDGDTFLTRDAGLNWKEIRKGAHLHEFGDHGAILLLVDDEEPTDHVWYSLDDGNTFHKFVFALSHTKQRIVSMTTEPQSTSRKFLLMGLSTEATPRFIVTALDFTGTETLQCVLDNNNEETDDFELWSPSADREGKCLFGQEIQYYRRIEGRDCYIGNEFEPTPKVIKHCPCTETDFECDYNFERDPAGSGKCDYHFKSSGYRKIPLSLCQGGLTLDKPREVYCPDKAASITLRLLLFLPFAAMLAGAIYLGLKNRRQSVGVALLALPGLVVILLHSIDWRRLLAYPLDLWDRIMSFKYRYAPVQQDEPASDLLMENYEDYFDHWEEEEA
ncbi:hypothetical protein BJ085DRAFT_15402 [Dimargaris cristalligena]|uniref:VPS10 domain-containing protein n=1 Tax=Dimargaris cristalligena TaxID=215637 RepID=A0A4V1J4D9_9FUNG|nr:hypothetical protein BJ085DRAFT_15402 [Dimargaris cristalligena]|eukprot:RKP35219.1 hypothetical protein BJ085DRAFT_15402 [Dimargaris cristalligena]